MPKENKISNADEVVLSIEYYHQHVFNYLNKIHQDRLRENLLRKPLAFRQHEFLSKLEFDKIYSGQDGWDICRAYLTKIEEFISKVLSTHSVFYWMHIYRRISPRPSELHESKTDPHTISLVRNIVEVAISKYGDTKNTIDLAPSKKIRIKDVLGGHYARLWERWLKDDKKALHQRYRNLLQSSQWVIVDFKISDYMNAFLVEGLSYEYWRVTAVMRAIGKGERFQKSGTWITQESDAMFGRMINSYDRRIGQNPFCASLVGGWLDPEFEGTNFESGVFIPVYNTRREDPTKYLHDFRVHLKPGVGFVSNFIPARFDLVKFYDAHAFLEHAFIAKRGYSLKSLLACLWALQDMVLFPAHALDFQRQEDGPLAADDPLLAQVLNLFQRAYAVAPREQGTIVEEIMMRLKISDFSLRDVLEAHVSACVSALTLSEESQGLVALWSSGPRFPLVPFGDALAIDLQGTPYLLNSAFVGVRDEVGQRGTIFEQGFAFALRSDKFDLDKDGQIISLTSERREIDVSVRISDCLILFECKAMERPLDFEIGRPETINRRIRMLDEKVEQALTLQEFVSKYPRGKNYDFTWAKRIASFVTSPFVEWIWNETPRLWYSNNVPRILSANEAISLLKQWRERKGIP